jgi:hypothetical protein
MAKKETSLKYRDLITQSDAEVAAEQVNLQVEQAALKFEQGLLSLQGDLLQAKSKVASAEAAVNSAVVNLNNAKKSSPDNLVQNIIDKKVAVDQAEENLSATKKTLDRIQEIYTYLVDTKKELF